MSRPVPAEKTLRQYLEMEKAFGVTELPASSVVQPPAQGPRLDASGAGKAEKASALAALYERHKGCLVCPLGSTRTHFVFGMGNPGARLMFIGEAPGFEEDKQGLPFVGAAGQLLTKIIEAMKLRRDDVYIANCLKCRPPGNRNPLPEEIEACSPILAAQLDIIRPQIVCALGKFAAQSLLGTDAPISRLRGQFHDFRGIKLMPTFHPAYLLRNPGDKKLVWEDMQKIMKEMGIS